MRHGRHGGGGTGEPAPAMAIELTLFFPCAIIKPKNAVLPRGFFDKLFGNKKNSDACFGRSLFAFCDIGSKGTQKWKS